MISTHYQDAYDFAFTYDKKLKATDFSDSVIVNHSDGSNFHWNFAFIKLWKEYVLVFTEHHKFYVFHKTDLESYAQYERKSVKKLKNTGITEVCEGCNKKFDIGDLNYDYHTCKKEYPEKCYTSYISELTALCDICGQDFKCPKCGENIYV